MFAIKDNKQIEINELDKAYYLELRYDIVEIDKEKIKIIEYSPRKAVTYAVYKKALDKIKKLEAEIDDIKKSNQKRQEQESEKIIKKCK